MVGSVLSENSSEIISYVLQYGKKFNQIETPYAVQLGGTLSNNIVTDINGFSEPFHFERLTLEVKDDEIILFTWYNIYTEKDIIKENVALMPFDEMMKNAENQLAVKYAYLENQDLSYMLYVDEIYLTYAVEPIKEEINQYMLIPVWAFYGGYDYGDGIKTPDGTILEGKYIEPYSLLTVNAIDGSIILGQ